MHMRSYYPSTVFTRIEARASISFRDFVDPACKQDQACNQGRLLFITLLSCTSVCLVHFRSWLAKGEMTVLVLEVEAMTAAK